MEQIFVYVLLGIIMILLMVVVHFVTIRVRHVQMQYLVRLATAPLITVCLTHHLLPSAPAHLATYKLPLPLPPLRAHPVTQNAKPVLPFPTTVNLVPHLATCPRTPQPLLYLPASATLAQYNPQ